MKITVKSRDDNSKDGTYVKPNKFSKRTKGSRIPIKDPNSHDSPERTKPRTPKATERTKSSGSSLKSCSNTEGATKDLAKAQRKQESEWKSLKKVDYQRLETVVEEGQVSSEESPSKSNCTPKDTGIEADVDPGSENLEKDSNVENQKQNLNAIEEKSEISTEDDEYKSQDTEITLDYQDTVECNVEEPQENMRPSDKNLTGMMEIFPIFSNDQFLCSRDAISIQESDELEVADKNHKQTVTETKSFYNEGKQTPPKESGDSGKVSEKIVRKKESHKRKLRHKILTDKKIVQKTSSQFINTLLMLDSFEEVRKNIIRGDALLRSGDELMKKKKLCQVKLSRVMKLLPAVILTTLGVLSICLGFAWKAYEPPRWIDYLLQFLPFRHRPSRTIVQQFFDYLLKSLFLFCGKPLK